MPHFYNDCDQVKHRSMWFEWSSLCSVYIIVFTAELDRQLYEVFVTGSYAHCLTQEKSISTVSEVMILA